MNDILICGDPHGNFKSILHAVESNNPKAIVMLGDYDLKKPLDTYLKPVIDAGVEIHWIAGNHDFDNEQYCENLFSSQLKPFDLNLKVIDICGTRIAGLAGIFKGKFWHPDTEPKFKNKKDWLLRQPSNIKKSVNKRGFPLIIKKAIWFDEVEQMKKKIRADILVSHEAPSCHKHGFSVIDELAKAIGAQQIFHGHHHEYYQDKLSNGINVVGVNIESVCNLQGIHLEGPHEQST